MINSSSDEEKKDKLPQQHGSNQSAQKTVDIYAKSELRDDDNDISLKKHFNTPNNQYVTQKFESSFFVEKRSEFNIEMMFHFLEGASEKIFSF